MQDEPRSEALQAADGLLSEYGEPPSRDTLRTLLALAWACGAHKGVVEAAETAKRAFDAA